MGFKFDQDTIAKVNALKAAAEKEEQIRRAAKEKEDVLSGKHEEDLKARRRAAEESAIKRAQLEHNTDPLAPKLMPRRSRNGDLIGYKQEDPIAYKQRIDKEYDNLSRGEGAAYLGKSGLRGAFAPAGTVVGIAEGGLSSSETVTEGMHNVGNLLDEGVIPGTGLDKDYANRLIGIRRAMWEQEKGFTTQEAKRYNELANKIARADAYGGSQPTGRAADKAPAYASPQERAEFKALSDKGVTGDSWLDYARKNPLALAGGVSQEVGEELSTLGLAKGLKPLASLGGKAFTPLMESAAAKTLASTAAKLPKASESVKGAAIALRNTATQSGLEVGQGYADTYETKKWEYYRQAKENNLDEESAMLLAERKAATVAGSQALLELGSEAIARAKFKGTQVEDLLFGKTTGINTVKTMLSEGTTEAISGVGGQLVENLVEGKDPTRGLMDAGMESFALGSLTGGAIAAPMAGAEMGANYIEGKRAAILDKPTTDTVQPAAPMSMQAAPVAGPAPTPKSAKFTSASDLVATTSPKDVPKVADGLIALINSKFDSDVAAADNAELPEVRAAAQQKRMEQVALAREWADTGVMPEALRPIADSLADTGSPLVDTNDFLKEVNMSQMSLELSEEGGASKTIFADEKTTANRLQKVIDNTENAQSVRTKASKLLQSLKDGTASAEFETKRKEAAAALANGDVAGAKKITDGLKKYGVWVVKDLENDKEGAAFATASAPSTAPQGSGFDLDEDTKQSTSATGSKTASSGTVLDPANMSAARTYALGKMIRNMTEAERKVFKTGLNNGTIKLTDGGERGKSGVGEYDAKTGTMYINLNQYAEKDTVAAIMRKVLSLGSRGTTFVNKGKTAEEILNQSADITDVIRHEVSHKRSDQRKAEKNKDPHSNKHGSVIRAAVSDKASNAADKFVEGKIETHAERIASMSDRDRARYSEALLIVSKDLEQDEKTAYGEQLLNTLVKDAGARERFIKSFKQKHPSADTKAIRKGVEAAVAAEIARREKSDRIVDFLGPTPAAVATANRESTSVRQAFADAGVLAPTSAERLVVGGMVKLAVNSEVSAEEMDKVAEIISTLTGTEVPTSYIEEYRRVLDMYRVATADELNGYGSKDVHFVTSDVFNVDDTPDPVEILKDLADEGGELGATAEAALDMLQQRRNYNRDPSPKDIKDKNGKYQDYLIAESKGVAKNIAANIADVVAQNAAFKAGLSEPTRAITAEAFKLANQIRAVVQNGPATKLPDNINYSLLGLPNTIVKDVAEVIGYAGGQRSGSMGSSWLNTRLNETEVLTEDEAEQEAILDLPQAPTEEKSQIIEGSGFDLEDYPEVDEYGNVVANDTPTIEQEDLTPAEAEVVNSAVQFDAEAPQAPAPANALAQLRLQYELILDPRTGLPVAESDGFARGLLYRMKKLGRGLLTYDMIPVVDMSLEEIVDRHNAEKDDFNADPDLPFDVTPAEEVSKEELFNQIKKQAFDQFKRSAKVISDAFRAMETFDDDERSGTAKARANIALREIDEHKKGKRTGSISQSYRAFITNAKSAIIADRMLSLDEKSDINEVLTEKEIAAYRHALSVLTVLETMERDGVASLGKLRAATFTKAQNDHEQLADVNQVSASSLAGLVARTIQERRETQRLLQSNNKADIAEGQRRAAADRVVYEAGKNQRLGDILPRKNSETNPLVYLRLSADIIRAVQSTGVLNGEADWSVKLKPSEQNPRGGGMIAVPLQSLIDLVMEINPSLDLSTDRKAKANLSAALFQALPRHFNRAIRPEQYKDVPRVTPRAKALMPIVDLHKASLRVSVPLGDGKTKTLVFKPIELNGGQDKVNVPVENRGLEFGEFGVEVLDNKGKIQAAQDAVDNAVLARDKALAKYTKGLIGPEEIVEAQNKLLDKEAWLNTLLGRQAVDRIKAELYARYNNTSDYVFDQDKISKIASLLGVYDIPVIVWRKVFLHEETVRNSTLSYVEGKKDQPSKITLTNDITGETREHIIQAGEEPLLAYVISLSRTRRSKALYHGDAEHENDVEELTDEIIGEFVNSAEGAAKGTYNEFVKEKAIKEFLTELYQDGIAETKGPESDSLVPNERWWADLEEDTDGVVRKDANKDEEPVKKTPTRSKPRRAKVVKVNPLRAVVDPGISKSAMEKKYEEAVDVLGVAKARSEEYLRAQEVVAEYQEYQTMLAMNAANPFIAKALLYADYVDSSHEPDIFETEGTNRDIARVRDYVADRMETLTYTGKELDRTSKGVLTVALFPKMATKSTDEEMATWMNRAVDLLNSGVVLVIPGPKSKTNFNAGNVYKAFSDNPKYEIVHDNDVAFVRKAATSPLVSVGFDKLMQARFKLAEPNASTSTHVRARFNVLQQLRRAANTPYEDENYYDANLLGLLRGFYHYDKAGIAAIRDSFFSQTTTDTYKAAHVMVGSDEVDIVADIAKDRKNRLYAESVDVASSTVGDLSKALPLILVSIDDTRNRLVAQLQDAMDVKEAHRRALLIAQELGGTTRGRDVYTSAVVAKNINAANQNVQNLRDAIVRLGELETQVRNPALGIIRSAVSDVDFGVQQVREARIVANILGPEATADMLSFAPRSGVTQDLGGRPLPMGGTRFEQLAEYEQRKERSELLRDLGASPLRNLAARMNAPTGSYMRAIRVSDLITKGLSEKNEDGTYKLNVERMQALWSAFDADGARPIRRTSLEFDDRHMFRKYAEDTPAPPWYPAGSSMPSDAEVAEERRRMDRSDDTKVTTAWLFDLPPRRESTADDTTTWSAGAVDSLVNLFMAVVAKFRSNSDAQQADRMAQELNGLREGVKARFAGEVTDIYRIMERNTLRDNAPTINKMIVQAFTSFSDPMLTNLAKEHTRAKLEARYGADAVELFDKSDALMTEVTRITEDTVARLRADPVLSANGGAAKMAALLEANKHSYMTTVYAIHDSNEASKWRRGVNNALDQYFTGRPMLYSTAEHYNIAEAAIDSLLASVRNSSQGHLGFSNQIQTRAAAAKALHDWVNGTDVSAEDDLVHYSSPLGSSKGNLKARSLVGPEMAPYRALLGEIDTATVRLFHSARRVSDVNFNVAMISEMLSRGLVKQVSDPAVQADPTKYVLVSDKVGRKLGEAFKGLAVRKDVAYALYDSVSIPTTWEDVAASSGPADAFPLAVKWALGKVSKLLGLEKMAAVLLNPILYVASLTTSFAHLPKALAQSKDWRKDLKTAMSLWLELVKSIVQTKRVIKDPELAKAFALMKAGNIIDSAEILESTKTLQGQTAPMIRPGEQDYVNKSFEGKLERSAYTAGGYLSSTIDALGKLFSLLESFPKIVLHLAYMDKMKDIAAANGEPISDLSAAAKAGTFVVREIASASNISKATKLAEKWGFTRMFGFFEATLSTVTVGPIQNIKELDRLAKTPEAKEIARKSYKWVVLGAISAVAMSALVMGPILRVLLAAGEPPEETQAARDARQLMSPKEKAEELYYIGDSPNGEPMFTSVTIAANSYDYFLVPAKRMWWKLRDKERTQDTYSDMFWDTFPEGWTTAILRQAFDGSDNELSPIEKMKYTGIAGYSKNVKEFGVNQYTLPGFRIKEIDPKVRLEKKLKMMYALSRGVADQIKEDDTVFTKSYTVDEWARRYGAPLDKAKGVAWEVYNYLDYKEKNGYRGSAYPLLPESADKHTKKSLKQIVSQMGKDNPNMNFAIEPSFSAFRDATNIKDSDTLMGGQKGRNRTDDVRMANLVSNMATHKAYMNPPQWREIVNPQFIRMKDGDSLVMNERGQIVEYRIYNIDTPEHFQLTSDGKTKAGIRAEETSTAIIKKAYADGKQVKFYTYGLDSNNRRLVSVKIDGKDMGTMLAKAGVAYSTKGGVDKEQLDFTHPAFYKKENPRK